MILGLLTIGSRVRIINLLRRISLYRNIEISFMSPIHSIFLGLVQGLTEFLPVSSSGHLVITQRLLPGFSQPGILFDIILHFGTLSAVLVYFRKKLTSYLHISYLQILAAGTLPAVILGLLFKNQIEVIFGNIRLVGCALIITGLFNYFTDKMKLKNNELRTGNVFIIGLFQALAIIPGLSRSGSTIFAGVFQGINKKKAAEFSFILSVPAVLGANLLEIFSAGNSSFQNLNLYIIGFMMAFLTGIVSLKLVFKFLTQKSFKYFAYYCFVVGMVIILL